MPVRPAARATRSCDKNQFRTGLYDTVPYRRSALRAGLGGEPCESPARALREPCASLAPHYNALWRSLKALRLLTVQMSFAHSFSSVARDELVLLPKAAKKTSEP